MTRRFLGLCLALLTMAVACGDDDDKAAEPPDTFCEAMSHLIVLLAPAGPTSPEATEAGFAEAAGWFEQANGAAPPAIADDFAGYKTSYDEYVHYLSTVGFNLDNVFSTDEGRQLAIETSHSLTPSIVEYVENDCGLSFGDEEHDPPTTGG